MLAATQNVDYAQEIMRILQKLPAEQAAHLLSYAQFLEAQASQGIEMAWLAAQDEASAEAVRASEQQWDELFERPETKMWMEQMALEALAEEEKDVTAETKFDKQS